jgi:hypothetical protein
LRLGVAQYDLFQIDVSKQIKNKNRPTPCQDLSAEQQSYVEIGKNFSTMGRPLDAVYGWLIEFIFFSPSPY